MNLFLNAVVGILLIFQVANSEAETDIGVGFNDDDDISCDPQIADTCFSDVNDDLRIIFNPNNNYFQTTNISLLRDLCSAWNDSLSCTSDIIDDGCQIADGRLKFDHWNEALRKTFEFVCKEDLRVLQDLFHSIRCFNISAFFNCVEKTANLKTVQDLMATNLDITECKYIQKVIQKCGEYVTADTCALEVLEPLDNIFGTFFDAADCSRSKSFEPKREASTNNGATTNQILTPVLVFIIILSMWPTWQEERPKNANEDVLKRAKEILKKGEYKEAQNNLEDVLQANPKLNKTIQELMKKVNSLKKEEVIINGYMENKNYKNALTHIDSILNDVSECRRVKILKAECFAHMNNYEKAKATIKEIEDKEKGKENDLAKLDVDYVKALVDFNEGRLKSALNITTEAWKKNKQHPKVKQLFFRVKYLQNQIDEAEDAVKKNNYQQAQILYSEVADIINEDNKNGENNRILAGVLKSKAETSLKMKAYIDVIADCERMINYRAYLADAYSYLVEAHIATGGADVAMKLLTKELENKALDKDTRKILERKLVEATAIREGEPLKKLKEMLRFIKYCKTPREIAKVNPDTTVNETEKLLKKLSIEFHSDKFQTQEQKNLAEEIFKLVQEAREKLNNEGSAGEKLAKLQQFWNKLKACRTPQELAGMKETAAEKEVQTKLKNMLEEYKLDNFTLDEQKQVAHEILKLIQNAIEELDLGDYNKLLERLRNCKTAREVVVMPEDTDKITVIKKLKQMYGKNHPDQVQGEKKKNIAAEIFKILKIFEEEVQKEK